MSDKKWMFQELQGNNFILIYFMPNGTPAVEVEFGSGEERIGEVKEFGSHQEAGIYAMASGYKKYLVAQAVKNH